MSKRKRPVLVRPRLTWDELQAMLGRARSSAAGKHGKWRKDRANAKRRAIEGDQ